MFILLIFLIHCQIISHFLNINKKYILYRLYIGPSELQDTVSASGSAVKTQYWSTTNKYPFTEVE